MVKTSNKNIAIEPFPPRSIKPVQMRGGVIGAAQKVELQASKVVFDTDDGKYKAGDTIYVRGDLAFQDWAANIQTIDGKQFVLISDSYVLVVSSA